MIDLKNKTREDFKFYTKRKSEYKEGKILKLLAVVEKGSDILKIEYTCPECGENDYLEKNFEKIPFSFNCSKCDFKIKVKKLKDI